MGEGSREAPPQRNGVSTDPRYQCPKVTAAIWELDGNIQANALLREKKYTLNELAQYQLPSKYGQLPLISFNFHRCQSSAPCEVRSYFNPPLPRRMGRLLKVAR